LESTLSDTLSKLSAGEMALRELTNLRNLLANRTEANRELETNLARQNEKIVGLESQVSSLLRRIESGEQKNRGLIEENLRLKANMNGLSDEKIRDVNRIKELNATQALQITKLESTLGETLSKLSAGEMAVRDATNLRNLLANRTEANRELEANATKQNEKIAGFEAQVSSLLRRIESGDQRNRGLIEENLKLKDNLTGITEEKIAK